MAICTHFWRHMAAHGGTSFYWPPSPVCSQRNLRKSQHVHVSLSARIARGPDPLAWPQGGKWSSKLHSPASRSCPVPILSEPQFLQLGISQTGSGRRQAGIAAGWPKPVASGKEGRVSRAALLCPRLVPTPQFRLFLSRLFRGCSATPRSPRG